MSAICCFNSDTGVVQKLSKRPLRSFDDLSDANALVQDLWELMPRENGDCKNAEHLAEVRRSIRAEDVSGARAAINRCVDDDAETANLFGVVAEIEGDLPSAQHHYQSALKRNRLCSAAEFNLRRYYEIVNFGRSNLPFYL